MNARYLSRNDIDLPAWDQLVEQSVQGGLFCKSWYLDALLGQHWTGILIYDKDRLQAIMPLYIGQKYFLTYAHQPVLARYWGICFDNVQFEDAEEEFSWKKKVVEAVIEALPSKLWSIILSLHPEFDYLLPFHWHGFQLTPKITYRLDLSGGAAHIESQFAKGVRKKMRKAIADGLQLREEFSIDPIISLLKRNETKGRVLLPSKFYDSVGKVFDACRIHDACYALSVYNAQQNLMASSLFVQDDHTTYFFSGYSDPEYRQSAAMPYLTAEGIKRACERTRQFDFMGSMEEGIEAYFRSFGPRPSVFFSIRRKRISLL